ncbi:glycosyl hydrolase family 18 protein [Pectinatus frisingensis]|uniref:glycosyl hydrolase family 18 protein n=1 Tax=Pectinatus frisingensis TaxID=865 RepID=UPI0018C5E4C6|nr:glycosyl hydrolase family 18 protein [Pectinatus frisingensis]
MYSIKIFIAFLLCSMMFFSTADAGIGNESQDSAKEKLNIIWQPTFDTANDLSRQPKIDGVNVISPSWLTIVKPNGFIKTAISENYVKRIHENGYKIWPLITNDFDKDLTHAFLNDPAAREYIIRQLVFYAEKNHFDGYNFDFENIYEQDRDALTSFIRQSAIVLHRENLTLSMDITIPSDNPVWSKCYDRKELAGPLDYLILMAYDEHSRLSSDSGSVASYDWVKKGLEATLAQGVPNDKLVLGVPLYMRLWREGEGKVTAQTLSMESAQSLIDKYNLSPHWLDDKKQYYFEYQDKNFRYRVWQEDSASLSQKLNLVSLYNLPGIASWRKGFETSDIWPLFNRKLNADKN